MSNLYRLTYQEKRAVSSKRMHLVDNSIDNAMDRLYSEVGEDITITTIDIVMNYIPT